MNTQTHQHSSVTTNDRILHGFDVVCGMEIDLAATKYRVGHQDVTYYFCSANCRQHFENNPTQYVG
jgi:Cu+-exporting ATPase